MVRWRASVAISFAVIETPNMQDAFVYLLLNALPLLADVAETTEVAEEASGGMGKTIGLIVFFTFATGLLFFALYKSPPEGIARTFYSMFKWTDTVFNVNPPISKRMIRNLIATQLAEKRFDRGREIAVEFDEMEIVINYLESQRRFIEAARGWVAEAQPEKAKPLFAKAVEQAVKEDAIRDAVVFAVEGELFDRAVELANDAEAHAVRLQAAVAYIGLKRYDDAVNVYLRENEDAKAVQTAIDGKMYDRAITICEQSYKPDVQQMAAAVYRQKGDLQKAMNLYMEYGQNDQAEEIARELGIGVEAKTEQTALADGESTPGKPKADDIFIPEYKPAPKVEAYDPSRPKPPESDAPAGYGVPLPMMPGMPGMPAMPGMLSAQGGAALPNVPAGAITPGSQVPFTPTPQFQADVSMGLQHMTIAQIMQMRRAGLTPGQAQGAAQENSSSNDSAYAGGWAPAEPTYQEGVAPVQSDGTATGNDENVAAVEPPVDSVEKPRKKKKRKSHTMSFDFDEAEQIRDKHIHFGDAPESSQENEPQPVDETPVSEIDDLNANDPQSAPDDANSGQETGVEPSVEPSAPTARDLLALLIKKKREISAKPVVDAPLSPDGSEGDALDSVPADVAQSEGMNDVESVPPYDPTFQEATEPFDAPPQNSERESEADASEPEPQRPAQPEPKKKKNPFAFDDF
ncbi:MAG: hypothetical protein ABIH86_01455 [Planctomycetota bacterium]